MKKKGNGSSEVIPMRDISVSSNSLRSEKTTQESAHDGLSEINKAAEKDLDPVENGMHYVAKFIQAVTTLGMSYERDKLKEKNDELETQKSQQKQRILELETEKIRLEIKVNALETSIDRLTRKLNKSEDSLKAASEVGEGTEKLLHRLSELKARYTKLMRRSEWETGVVNRVNTLNKRLLKAQDKRLATIAKLRGKIKVNRASVDRHGEQYDQFRETNKFATQADILRCLQALEKNRLLFMGSQDVGRDVNLDSTDLQSEVSVIENIRMQLDIMSRHLKALEKSALDEKLDIKYQQQFREILTLVESLRQEIEKDDLTNRSTSGNKSHDQTTKSNTSKNMGLFRHRRSKSWPLETPSANERSVQRQRLSRSCEVKLGQ